MPPKLNTADWVAPKLEALLIEADLAAAALRGDRINDDGDNLAPVPDDGERCGSDRRPTSSEARAATAESPSVVDGECMGDGLATALGAGELSCC